MIHDGGLEPGSRPYLRLQAALFFIGLATFAQLFAPQGLLPLIATDQVVTADQAGLMISTATLGLALGLIPWSYTGDRFGRRPAMSWALAAACVLAALSALVPWLPLALVMRFLMGFMLAGISALAVTYLTEEVTPRAAAVAAGVFISGNTIGGVIGRLIAAPIGEQFGWRAGLLTTTSLAVVCLLLFVRLAPSAQNFVPSRTRFRARVAALTGNLRSKALWGLYVQGFLSMGGFVAMYNYMGFRLSAPPFGLPLGVAALIFLAYLAGTVTSPLAGKLANRFRRKPVLLAGNLTMAVGVTLTLIPNLAGTIFGMVVLTAGFFASHAIAVGWAGTSAVAGRSQSVSLYNLGVYIGSSIIGYAGGLLFQFAGWPGNVTMVLASITLATLLIAVVLPKT